MAPASPSTRCCRSFRGCRRSFRSSLIADPAVIERQVVTLSEVLPPDVLAGVEQLHEPHRGAPGTLGIGLSSASRWRCGRTSGTGSLMQALTVLTKKKHARRLRFYLRAIALAITIGIFGLISLFQLQWYLRQWLAATSRSIARGVAPDPLQSPRRAGVCGACRRLSFAWRDEPTLHCSSPAQSPPRCCGHQFRRVFIHVTHAAPMTRPMAPSGPWWCC